jgi:hypothetical protein
MPEARKQHSGSATESKDSKNDVPEERAAQPRKQDPKDDAEGLTRLIANNPADDANPRKTQKDSKINKSDEDEKVIEGGVAASEDKAATEWSLTSHSL